MAWETEVQFQVESFKDSKMVLDTSLLNTQRYNVRIKGKVEQSREESSAPLPIDVVAIEKGAYGSPLTRVTNYTLLMLTANKLPKYIFPQSAGAVEYTNCTSTEGKTPQQVSRILH